MIIELHAHTKEGSHCSHISVKDKIKILISKGYDAVLLTDHESIEGYNAIKNNMPDNIKVFCGFEFSTTEGDILCILPNNQYLSYQKLTPIELIDKIHSLNGVCGLAHPYRDNCSIGCNVNEEYLNEIAKKCDFIETNNAKSTFVDNLKANELANKLKIFKTNGSDSHTATGTGLVINNFPDTIKTQQDLIDYIKSAKYKK